MENLNVKWAVIPCAGKGTRFLPITKGVPKEMCPIIDRPTVDFIIEECIDSGIENIVLVISEGKEDIIRYYSEDSDYEDELRAKGKGDLADLIHKIATKVKIHYVLQEELLGLGHAVLITKEIVKDNNFCVLCGDDICLYEWKAPLKQLIEAFVKTDGKTIVGGQRVPHDEIVKYGCMNVENEVFSKVYSLKGIVEKPTKEEATSDLASLGKWVFNSRIYEALEVTPRGKGGEIQLTDAIALLIENEEPVYFGEFIGKRYDCGDKLGYITAIIDVALKRDDLKDGVKKHLLKIMGEE
ncbi:MAG TPA: UTP--glucose-1-phosphate uridylyltransferase [Candidatus Onthovivens sp.]|nr:UTP--glucose-1-phosphate uridylyltransferase [Candidatus Onthovivens sp.]